MKKQALMLFLVLSVSYGYSQKVVWQKTFGGEHSEYLFDMVPTVDYGFLLAGSSLSDKTGLKKQNGNGSLDYYLWKMDQHGEEEWQLSFGGDGQDILKNISATSDQGYILGGYSDSGKTGNKLCENLGRNDLWIIKINARGEQQWQQGYGGDGDDRLVQIRQTPDGGYLIAATTNSPKGTGKKDDRYGGLDYWILKTDKTGKVEWEKTLGGLYNDEPRTIVFTEKGYLIGGVSNSPASGTKQKDNYGGYDMWIVELDEKGNQLNEYVLGSENDDELNQIFVSADKKGYTVTGSTYGEGGSGNLTVKAENGSDFVVVHTDQKFEPKEQFGFDLKGSEVLTSTAMTPEGNVLLSGYKQDAKTRKKKLCSRAGKRKRRTGMGQGALHKRR